MVINLATIDFCPGQGGGSDPVIRTLDVTENGTYRAPEGVDGYSPVNVNVSGGGSITPEEQAALDTLVNASEGVLYTDGFKRYIQKDVTFENIYADAISAVSWDDLYIINNGYLYKLNRESYQFDIINHFDNMWTGPSFFGDNSGRFYWNGYELDLENGTIGQDNINLPDYYRNSSLQNIFYGEYGVWIIGYSAYKFNETSQQFEEMTLNNTSGYSGQDFCQNIFKYDGHILGVYGSVTFEITEYEDHIDIADVTNVYFNMPLFGFNGYNFKSTKDDDLYYASGYDVYTYDKSLSDWVHIDNAYVRSPIYGSSALVSDNIMFSSYGGTLSYMNLGPEFKDTFWANISNIAVDLTSNQKINGYKQFIGGVQSEDIQVSYISPLNDTVSIAAANIKNVGANIVFLNNQGNETIVKNGSKHIATVDQTFLNSTFIPYGTDGDNIGYVDGSPEMYFNFYTYTNRIFKKVGSDWNEFNGTHTLIPVTFGFDFNSDIVYNSPTMTIAIRWDGISAFNTYMWDDANTEWDLICSSESVGGNIWFDGDDFRSGNDFKLEETGGVWNWVSDPLVNDIWASNLTFCCKSGEVYAYNDSDWYLYKYDKVDCRLDKIGFVNAGKMCVFFDELFITLNSNETYIIDLSKVDPQDPDKVLLGEYLFNRSQYSFIGATDRLWFFDTVNQMHSSYQYIYETPEVPASNGTYVLKATVLNGEVTYSWVPEV